MVFEVYDKPSGSVVKRHYSPRRPSPTRSTVVFPDLRLTLSLERAPPRASVGPLSIHKKEMGILSREVYFAKRKVLIFTNLHIEKRKLYLLRKLHQKKEKGFRRLYGRLFEINRLEKGSWVKQ